MASAPRPHIVLPTRALPVDGTDATMRTQWAGVVAYLGGTRDQRKAFLRCVGRTPGLIANVVERVGGHGSTSAVELVGDPGLVAGAVELQPVVRWHYIMSTPVPRQAQGTGPEKQRPSRTPPSLTTDLDGYTKPADRAFDRFQAEERAAILRRRKLDQMARRGAGAE
jgi:hypothetical protein